MQRTYELKTDQTLETIKILEGRGIDRMAVILRHSERDFTDNPSHEPFMGLTDHGKSFAFDMGRNLPKKFKPRLFSSFFGRCIETAYLIDKGYSLEHGTLLDHNQTHELLAPFYIKDIEQAVTKVRKLGTRDFIRTWFDRKIDESVIILPEDTADMVCSHMVDRLKALDVEEIVSQGLTRQNMCCSGAAAAAAAACKKMGAAKGICLDYATSYEISRSDSFVGYCGMVFAAA